MTDILLVDLSSIFWMAYAVSGSDDAGASARRSVGRIRALARNYEHCAICCDARGKNWRHELSPIYKAQREAKPPEAYAQLRNTIAQLERDGFPIWISNGFEADDVIATATRIALSKGLKVTIASADKDLLQLVGPDVMMLSTRDEGKVWGPNEVREKYGVGPGELGDWLAMTGDTSDNVPGIPSIGPKGATALISRFSTLEGTLAAARADDAALLWDLRASQGEAVEELGPRPDVPNPPIKPAAKKAILDHADQARMSRRLVELRFDVPIDFDAALKPRVEQRPTAATEFDRNEEDQMTDTDKAPESGEAEKKPEEPAPSAQPVSTDAKTEPAPAPVAPAPAQRASVGEFDATPPAPAAIVPVIEWERSLEPRTLRDAYKVAIELFESRMFAHLNNPQGVFTAALLARAHGIETMKILMPGMLHNIRGRLSMSAQLIVGLVLRSGKCEFFDLVSSSTTKAVYITKRIGGRREVEFEYTIEEARAAGLLEPTKNGEPSMYIKRPKTMLRHRCETELARAVYPDVVGGLYTPDEIGEVQDAA